jgi:hypothetical protein
MKRNKFQKRASLKSHKSKRDFFTRRFLFPLFFTLSGLCIVDGLSGQRFDCRRDKLDATTIRFSPEPSSLTIGQPCEISIYNRSGRKVLGSDFSISSNNINLISSDLTFHIDQKVKGDSWIHLNGELVEQDVKFTLAHNTCFHTYDYSFHIKQNYVFDNVLNCQGETRTFAVSRYKNELNKNLYVVVDVNQKSVYLLEGPITIDGSGVGRGRNGRDGQYGQNGLNGERGRFSIQENNDVRQYFENTNHPYFKIDNIEND